MDIKVLDLQNTLDAAKALGLKAIPWSWIKYIQCGWAIQPATCRCGGQWVWKRPLVSGDMITYGCVCHNRLDVSRLLDTKEGSTVSMRQLIISTKPNRNDIGKIFYTHDRANTTGTIINREEFVKLDPASVNLWTELNESNISELPFEPIDQPK